MTRLSINQQLLRHLFKIKSSAKRKRCDARKLKLCSIWIVFVQEKIRLCWCFVRGPSFQKISKIPLTGIFYQIESRGYPKTVFFYPFSCPLSKSLIKLNQLVESWHRMVKHSLCSKLPKYRYLQIYNIQLITITCQSE